MVMMAIVTGTVMLMTTDSLIILMQLMTIMAMGITAIMDHTGTGVIMTVGGMMVTGIIITAIGMDTGTVIGIMAGLVIGIIGGKRPLVHN